MRNLKVHNVLDVRTGKIFLARNLLGKMSQQEKHELRSLQLGKQKILNYACPVCDQKVYLSGGNRVYHFRHFPHLGHCPLKGGTIPSREELLCMMYNGAKESDHHWELKTWLGSFLKSIEHKSNFSNTNIEKRINSTKDRIHWRQPDVSCFYHGKRLVFELQLNGTFVEVIQGREHFYSEEKTFISWLFDSFSPNDTDFGERDIFWLNKSNAFALTKEARLLSEEKQELFLECHYLKPRIEDDDVKEDWEKCLIPFSSLQLNEGYYKPFYYDSDTERRKLKEQVLVPRFMDYLLGKERKNSSSIERREDDARFMQRLRSIQPNLELPEVLTLALINIVDAIKFLKFGTTSVQFNNFSNIKNYTNQILNSYDEFGYIFIMAIKVYRPEFKRDELGEKIKAKLETFWHELSTAKKTGTSDGQNKSYDGLLWVIFPELRAYLSGSTEPAKEIV